MRKFRVKQFASWLLFVASFIGWIGGFGYLAYYGQWVIAVCAAAGGFVGFYTSLRWMLDTARGNDKD